jgi:DNA-binding response OmpR family regulator
LDAYEVRFRSIAELAEVFTTELVQRRLFVVGAHRTPNGEDISIRIVLPETQSVMHATGLVLEHRTGDPRGMGADVVLLDLLDETISLIEQFITERLDASQPEQEPPALDRPLEVLIVEDDAIYREQAASAFRRAGDHVRFAHDGFEALASALRYKPDVILSDVNMPRMDGWQLLRMVRGNAKLAKVPVLFTTALAGERERLRGYQLGVDDYVAKPFRPVELRARAERLVRRSETDVAPALVRTTIRGDLAQVSVCSVLSLLELEQRSGALSVEGDVTGVLWIAAGRALRAEIHSPVDINGTAIDRAMRLLSASAGEFVFAADEHCGADELHTSITALLMEHARVTDEALRRGA